MWTWRLFYCFRLSKFDFRSSVPSELASENDDRTGNCFMYVRVLHARFHANKRNMCEGTHKRRFALPSGQIMLADGDGRVIAPIVSFSRRQHTNKCCAKCLENTNLFAAGCTGKSKTCRVQRVAKWTADCRRGWLHNL